MEPDPVKVAQTALRHGYKLSTFSTPPKNGLGVSIAVGLTSSLSLEPTLHLVKAALLYADHVTLYSIPAFVFQSMKQLRAASPDQRLDLLADFMPLMGAEEYSESLSQMKDILRLTKGLKGLPKDVLVMREKFERLTKGLGARMNDAMSDQFGQIHSQELEKAIRSGLITVQPIGNGNMDSTMIYHFLEVLETITQQSANLPLLDEQSKKVLNSGIELGLVDRPTAAAGSKHPSVAADFIERLPVVSSDMATILDIRKELTPHVKPFREAMIGFSRDISAQPWEDDFAKEAELMYHEKVSPEIQRIEDALKSNTAFTRAIAALTTPTTMAGSTIGFGIGQALSVSAAAIATPVVGGIAAATKAIKEHSDEMRRIKGNQLYFYYQASKK